MRQPSLPSSSPPTTSPKIQKPTETVAGATKIHQKHRIKITMKLSLRNNRKTKHQDKIAEQSNKSPKTAAQTTTKRLDPTPQHPPPEKRQELLNTTGITKPTESFEPPTQPTLPTPRIQTPTIYCPSHKNQNTT
jgi:hypothetical protein